MIKKLLLPIIITAAFVLQSCSSISQLQDLKEPTMNRLIPEPVIVDETTGFFVLDARSNIFVSSWNAENRAVAGYLADKLKSSTGFDINVLPESNAIPGEKRILLSSTLNDSQLGKEGYLLSVTNNLVKLESNTTEGLFRGIQTIRQLFPAQIESKTVQNIDWTIPAGIIRDYPRFEWRGTMLDVARHFFSVEDVKAYIDVLAYYKFNRFHLHLSDDQGWRIEIRSWPKLTQVGGSSSVNDEKPGFYTQEEYAEIVRYADERFITVVPEIDMPGHTHAAIVSYPFLNAKDTTVSLYTGIHVGFSSFNIKTDSTYLFINDVIKEVSALTTGEYFHIGGDEAHSTDSVEYIYFVERVQDIVKQHGKKMIGWEEIAQAKLHNTSVAQLWRNKLAAEAVAQGCKAILSPSPKVYIDMKYDSSTELGLNWAGFIEVNTAYEWDPAKYNEGIKEDDMLGVEAPLWAETIVKLDDIEFLAFPRLLAVAEIGWTPQDLRNWDKFKIRLGSHGRRLNLLDINFYKSPLIDWQ